MPKLATIPLEALSDAAQRFAGPQAPAQAKMMAARGMAPLTPKDLLAVLATLVLDRDQQLAGAARESLAKLPDRIVTGALGERLHYAVLHELARHLGGVAQYAELIILNHAAADETIAMLAERVGERQLEIISQNETRLERHPAIIEALYLNPHTRMSTVDRVMELAVRRGLNLTAIPAFKEAQAAILGTIAAEPAAEQPPVVLTPVEPGAAADGVPVVVGRAPAVGPDALDPEEIAVLAEEPDDEEAASAEKGPPTTAILSRLTASQRIRWAVIGNREVRNHLMRDSNRIVATAAIKNPRVTEQEVNTISQSRAVNDEVIRTIAYSRDWTKSYQVRLNLVNNPKCPLPQALTFLKTLRATDLKRLAKSKNVPNVVSTTARRLSSDRR